MSLPLLSTCKLLREAWTHFTSVKLQGIHNVRTGTFGRAGGPIISMAPPAQTAFHYIQSRPLFRQPSFLPSRRPLTRSLRRRPTQAAAERGNNRVCLFLPLSLPSPAPYVIRFVKLLHPNSLLLLLLPRPLLWWRRLFLKVVQDLVEEEAEGGGEAEDSPEKDEKEGRKGENSKISTTTTTAAAELWKTTTMKTHFASGNGAKLPPSPP